MRTHATALACAISITFLPCFSGAQERATAEESAAQTQLRASAAAAFEAGRPEEAVELLQGYLQLGPTDVAYIDLGAAQIAAGQCEQAAASLDAAAFSPRLAAISEEQVADRLGRARGELALSCAGAVEPEVLYALGLEYFEQRNWLRAAKAFRLAFEDDPNTILAYNAGRSFEYAGDLDNAVAFYQKALDLDPDADLKDRIERTLERLGNLQARTTTGEEVGLLDVASKPSGALVKVDGVVVGETPYQAAHPVGTYEVSVELEGFSDYERDVELEASKEVIIDVQLSASGRFWTWISLASTLATAGGGVGLGLLAENALSDARDPVTRRDPGAFQDATDRGRILSGTSIALYSVAAVGAALTVWLYFIEAPDPLDRGAARVTVGPQYIGFAFDW